VSGPLRDAVAEIARHSAGVRLVAPPNRFLPNRFLPRFSK
jgi:hypothetical protein